MALRVPRVAPRPSLAEPLANHDGIQIKSLFRAIGNCLITIVNAIGTVLHAIVNGIVSVIDIIISCLTCGRSGRRRSRMRTTTRI